MKYIYSYTYTETLEIEVELPEGATEEEIRDKALSRPSKCWDSLSYEINDEEFLPKGLDT